MRTPARLGASVASLSLVLTGAAVAASPADATASQASAAATWLAGQLGSDGLLPGQFGGGDVGVSIDAGFSLAALGGQSAAVTKVADAVTGDKGVGYLEYTYSFGGDSYAGQAANATAKALAFLQSLPTPRATIGSINVKDRMESLTTDTGATAGRIADVSTKNGTPDGQDFANTLGQSFAARGLAAAGSSEAANALAFLLQQQCPGGGFRLEFAAPAAAQQCTNDAQASVDTTALAVNQLSHVPATPSTVLSRARTWLAAQQAGNGSFGGGTGTSGANSNSTGLAAQARGDTAAGRKAASWVAAHQRAAGRSDAGAIAYDDAAVAKNPSTTDPADRDQWQRATAQAAPALQLAPAALDLTGPTAYQRAGSRVTLSTRGGVSGDTLTLTGPGTSATTVSDGRTWNRVVTLPAGTGVRTYRVTDGARSDTRAVKALGPARLTVARSKYRVHKGRFVTVAIRGLAAGERTVISYKQHVVRVTTATRDGKAWARFRVGRVKGVKTVTAVGQFSDIRRGSTTIKVIR